jgi:hypothetical protein
MMEGRDFKLIPKKCWEILTERFKGTEIVRYKDPDTYSRKYFVKFPVVRFPYFIHLDTYFDSSTCKFVETR